MSPHARSLRFEPLEDRRLLATTTIKVLAAGSTGTEQFQLSVAKPTGGFDRFTGTVTQVLTPSRTFQTFTFTVPYAAVARNVTVSFTNDGLTAAGADRNLTVDGILLGATKYESESPATVGSDAYDPVNDQTGPITGYLKRETLYSGGYFRYETDSSTISIYAAGSTHEERMQLLIDGTVVATFNNIAGDYGARKFATYSFTYGGSVSPDRVRVAFVNDGLTATGADRNLRVDSISISNTTPNGTTKTFYQSEVQSVFSTGLYISGEGVYTGRSLSEFLHVNGFFQYGFAPQQSWIQIPAAGRTGTETARLTLFGKNVATYTNVGGNYGTGVYQSLFFFNTRSFPVPINQIRVNFVNDGTTSTGLDRNLRVDAVILDGARYESESPNTYTNATYTPGVGRTSGYLRTEYLHLNGYFQYAASPPPAALTANPTAPVAAQSTATAKQSTLQPAATAPTPIATNIPLPATAKSAALLATKKPLTSIANNSALTQTLAWR